jgi:Glucose-6-phosphate dehydrogenase, NAD binding domain
VREKRTGGAEVGKTNDRAAAADALVLFGATGDLAHKKTFPALRGGQKLLSKPATEDSATEVVKPIREALNSKPSLGFEPRASSLP